MPVSDAGLPRHRLRASIAPRLTSLSGGLVIAVVIACLMIVGVEGWHAWESHSQIIAADEIDRTNLTRSLAQHAHDLVQAADVVLLHMRELVGLDGLTPEGLERINQRMLQTIQAMPMIHGLFVYDAAGDWRVNSVSKVPFTFNNSDRDYFQYHRTHHEDRVFLGKPVRSRSDGQWIITVSRRIDAPGGVFAGVILVTISSEALRQFYATFDLGKTGVITLLSSDGIVMAREPSGSTTVGTDVSHSPISPIFLPQALVGNLAAVSPVDGISRLRSYRRVADYPLILVVSRGLDQVLQPWRADVARHAASSIVMIGALAGVGLRLAIQIGRARRADRRYRLLADNASDVIVCVTLDGRRLYLSPAFATLTGWDVQEGLERPWQDFVHPNDRPGVLEIASCLRAGTAPPATTIRYVCKDGQHRWAEARVQPIRPGDDAEARFVINLRDITERKLAEDQVESLNRQLAIQAATDSLTGLTNRRRFDEGLLQEWRRAVRERRALSLAVIDIDHFKRFNDRYGHQRGDQCLRLVASAVGSCARRSGDIAARYGGEEFVLLLPGADAAAAPACAEQVRSAVEAMGLEHADNPPSGLITVSVGIATLDPIPDTVSISSEDLFAAADAALYEAKRSGRNRTMVRDLSVNPLVDG
jgi:diguanylate cyclase (GGDEF)-like protein/PAS domain S-box-containing protein